MPPPGNRSFAEMVEHIKRTQNVDDESARKIVGSIEHKIKHGKLKLKLMQLQANQYGDTEEQARARELITTVQKNRKLQPYMNSPEGRKANKLYVEKGVKINPKEHLKKERMQGAKKNDHLVSWYNTPLVKYASMKLVEDNGKFAKYWLLNAKDVNGNDWGVVPNSIDENIISFINRPFVITAKKWIPDSIYGDVFDHPHIPTNDMNLILKHQEHFRVANIVDVHERDGEWFAIIERDPKYAHLTLPPFCSPAIYQLDALEHESALSKWTGLHLAGLDENPAYGARIAILRGTCDGPRGQCIHQLKEAKLNPGSPKWLEYQDMMDRNSADNDIVDKEEMEDEEIKRKILGARLQLMALKIPKKEYVDFKRGIGKMYRVPDKNKSPLEREKMQGFWENKDTEANQLSTMGRTRDDEKTDLSEEDTYGGNGREEIDQREIDVSKRINPEHPHPTYETIKKIRSGKIKLLKMKLANIELDESEKLPLKRNKIGLIDYLRKKGRSVDASHNHATFLSPDGEFIGGGRRGSDSHIQQLDKHFKFPPTIGVDFREAMFNDEKNLFKAMKQTGLIRVQNTTINTSRRNERGKHNISLDINTKLTGSQIRAIKDLEAFGHSVSGNNERQGVQVGAENIIRDNGKNFSQPPDLLRKDLPAKILQAKLQLMKIAIRQTFPKIADVKINPEHGRIIADAYDQMKHEPNNPEVKAAYGALISETGKQYEDLLKGGLKVTKVTDEANGYKNSEQMHRDVLENNHLNYFPTEGGFGSDGKENKDHPMLKPTKFKDPEGKTMLANDVFRIVHDINGHVRGEPSGFGPRGEQQAYLTHKQMFSPKANKALFTETAGQNNWVNFNKKSGESNRKNPRNTQYAEQKAGLLPPNIIYGKWHR